jgi:hypothetical protein
METCEFQVSAKPHPDQYEILRDCQIFSQIKTLENFNGRPKQMGPEN